MKLLVIFLCAAFASSCSKSKVKNEVGVQVTFDESACTFTATWTPPEGHSVVDSTAEVFDEDGLQHIDEGNGATVTGTYDADTNELWLSAGTASEDDMKHMQSRITEHPMFSK